jgi:hypothetical protein
MYACTPEIERGFFEVVCGQGNQPPAFRDPPPPRYAIELEPWQWGSGPIWIMRRVTVDSDLA